MTELEAAQLQLETICGTVFSPSAPINKLALFAGRLEQITKLRARHALTIAELSSQGKSAGVDSQHAVKPLPNVGLLAMFLIIACSGVTAQSPQLEQV